MRESGQGYPDNRQPQWYGKARRGKAEETDGLKDAIDNDTYKGSALGDIERQIDFGGSSIKNCLDCTRQTENTSN